MNKVMTNLITIVCLVGTASIASAGQVYNWQTVQPTAGPVVVKPEAYLKVYSEAHVYEDGDIPRVNRVPYTIYSEDGKKLRFIAFNDQDPKLVTLPPGKYVIVPDTNLTKTEVYGAILKQGQLTELHMKGEDPTYAPVGF